MVNHRFTTFEKGKKYTEQVACTELNELSLLYAQANPEKSEIEEVLKNVTDSNSFSSVASTADNYSWKYKIPCVHEADGSEKLSAKKSEYVILLPETDIQVLG